jgi:hypothetical protein
LLLLLPPAIPAGVAAAACELLPLLLLPLLLVVVVVPLMLSLQGPGPASDENRVLLQNLCAHKLGAGSCSSMS